MIINRITGKTTLYYVSTNPKLDGDLVFPCIPNNYLTKNKWEDAAIPRVKLYDNIDDAISGQFLGQILSPGTKLFVYQSQGASISNLLETSLTTTPYALLVNEVWYTAPLRVKKIMEVEISDLNKEEYYHYGPRSTKGVLYRWNWEKVLKPWEKRKRDKKD